MKRFVIGGLVLSALVYLPGQSFAERGYHHDGGRFYSRQAEDYFPGISLDVRVGGSTAELGELKTAMNNFTGSELNYFTHFYDLTEDPTFDDNDTTLATLGVDVMGTLFANLTPNFALGMKAIYFEPAQITTGITAYGEDASLHQVHLEYDFGMSTSLTAILFGAQFKTPRTHRGVSWAMSFMAGPAFAHATTDISESIDDSGAGITYFNKSVLLSGTGVYTELALSSEYLLDENFGFNAGLGFHYCAIAQMKSAGDNPNKVGYYQPAYSGTTLYDIDGNNLIFNFGGIDFNVGATLYF